jgi:predicted metal-binding membrane protein
MGDTVPLEWLLRRDRRVAMAALTAVVILAWAYLLLGAGMDMSAAVSGSVMPMAWSPGHAALMTLMWALMMLAMMLPSAAPMVLLYATVSRRRDPERGGHRAFLFTLGYATIWCSFAVGATAAQWALDRAALLTPAMSVGSTVAASLLFLGAGVYQFTPVKQACLQQCRSPLEFLVEHWRGGGTGAFILGAHHGAYCVGCCSAVMVLLFVGGVMNIAWIAGLALLVLAEKLLPSGQLVGRVLGVGLIGGGVLGLLAAIMV